MLKTLNLKKEINKNILNNYRPVDVASPDLAIIEDDLNLDELMKQKALLQARLGAYMSDTEGDDSRSGSLAKRPTKEVEMNTKKIYPTAAGSENIITIEQANSASTTTSKNNLNSISKDKLSNQNDIILLDDSSGGNNTPVDKRSTSKQRSRKVRHSSERDRRSGRGHRSATPPAAPTIKEKQNDHRLSRDYRDNQKRHSLPERHQRSIRSRSRSTGRRVDSHDRRHHVDIEEDRSRQRHREHYDQNRQKEDLRQEINRDKLRERDNSRDGENKGRDDRTRITDRSGGRGQDRGRDRHRERERWMRERSHSRSKAESDRKRERERERQRFGHDRNDRDRHETKDRDRYRGSLSEGQKAQQKESSSDEEVNININIDEEDDDEEKIIEMRRKQREELLKVKLLNIKICVYNKYL